MNKDRLQIDEQKLIELLKKKYPNNDIGELSYRIEEEYVEFWDKTANCGDGLWIDTDFKDIKGFEYEQR